MVTSKASLSYLFFHRLFIKIKHRSVSCMLMKIIVIGVLEKKTLTEKLQVRIEKKLFLGGATAEGKNAMCLSQYSVNAELHNWSAPLAQNGDALLTKRCFTADTSMMQVWLETCTQLTLTLTLTRTHSSFTTCNEWYATHPKCIPQTCRYFLCFPGCYILFDTNHSSWSSKLLGQWWRVTKCIYSSS